MENDKFNELLMAILKKWDDTSADAVLNDNTGDLELTEENQQIFAQICKNIDDAAQKLDELHSYVEEGGTRDEWLDDKISNALESIDATDEQKTQALELMHKSIEKATADLMLEVEGYGIDSSKEETINADKENITITPAKTSIESSKEETIDADKEDITITPAK